jgi:hypothetical protein
MKILTRLPAVSPSFEQSGSGPNLSDSLPTEFYIPEKPDVSHLRIFGSLTYVHVPKEKRTKLMSHSNLGVFVGYTDTTRMVRVYDPVKKEVKQYRDVHIDESRGWKDRIRVPGDDVDDEDTYAYEPPIFTQSKPETTTTTTTTVTTSRFGTQALSPKATEATQGALQPMNEAIEEPGMRAGTLFWTCCITKVTRGRRCCGR